MKHFFVCFEVKYVDNVFFRLYQNIRTMRVKIFLKIFIYRNNVKNRVAGRWWNPWRDRFDPHWALRTYGILCQAQQWRLEYWSSYSLLWESTCNNIDKNENSYKNFFLKKKKNTSQKHFSMLFYDRNHCMFRVFQQQIPFPG